MKSSTIRKVIIFGALAVAGIIAMQSYWWLRTWNLKEQEFHEKVNIALLNVAKGFEQLGISLPEYDLINKMTSNYYIVNVRSDINEQTLEYLLRRELEAVELTEDFEFGIYNCESEEMIYGNYVSYKPGEDTVYLERTELPAIGELDYYFGVRFPNKTSHIFSQMTVNIIFAVILLFTVAFFIYSMFIILQQKRLSELQKDFINNMTHEFKTPISTIKISSDFFLKNPMIKSNERLLKYAEIIKEQNTRLNNQVEKVLQIARMEKSSFKINKQKINIHELLNLVVESVKLEINNNSGKILCELKAKHPEIKADKLHLTNVIYNLLDNAAKYCKTNPEIKICTEDVEGKLKLSIRDNGIGIKKEYQKHIFKKFYRVPTGDIHDVKGFGLGLFYVKGVCDAHGWKVQLESEINVGTTISIYF